MPIDPRLIAALAQLDPMQQVAQRQTPPLPEMGGGGMGYGGGGGALRQVPDPRASMSPQQIQVRINQLQYDRSLARKMGVDVDGESYAPVRNELNALRALLNNYGNQ